jgi:hypothetical protein
MGIIYKTIYPFEALTKIREGKEVFFLDRREKKARHTDEVYPSTLLKAIDEAQTNNNNQYEFWYEEREEITERS